MDDAAGALVSLRRCQRAFCNMPSLRLLTISILVVSGLSGGLAWAALTAGEVLGQGSADIALGLMQVAPPEQSATTLPSAQAARKHKPASTGESGAVQPAPSATGAARPSKAERASMKRAPRARQTSIIDGREPGMVPRSRLAAGVSPSPSAAASRWLSKRLLSASPDAPTCDGVHVYIVSAFENPSDSVATLALDAKQRGRQRRVGQRLGPYEVIAIGYNPSRVSSAVWLAQGNRVCQALVRDVNPVREKARQRQLRRAAKARARKRARKKKRARRAKRRRRR